MKRGRHRRYEEARNLKRGPDLDVEALFADLEGEPAVVAAVVEETAAADDYDAIDHDGPGLDGPDYDTSDDIES